MIIKIKNLKARAIIGIYDWEKKSERDLIINLKIEIDGNEAADSDKLKDTVDYDSITEKVLEETSKSRFNLIEKLASHLLDIIMQDDKIICTKIEIDKPGAVEAAESISVIEERVR